MLQKNGFPRNAPMTKTIAVDTNVLLDYLFKRDPGFNRSAKLIEDCLADKVQIFIPNIVFAEVEWVLRSYYKQNKEFIVQFLEGLLVIDGVITEDKVSIRHALNFYRQPNIKFTDSIILTQIQKFDPDEFLTFDEDLKKLYQKSFKN